MTTKNITTLFTPSASFSRPSKLNILMLDSSGSMGWAISSLVKETINRVNNLPLGDAVLIGWFSGKNQFEWITLTELHKQEDFKLVEDSISSKLYARGLTCFSDIIADTPNRINPLLSKYPVVTLTFMSDGYPTVSNIQEEYNAITTKCKELKNYLTAGAVVVFGDYANRDLLSKMAQDMGLELVSGKAVQDIGNAFSKVTDSKTSSKVKVTVPKGDTLVLGKSENSFTLYPIEKGEAFVSDSETILSFPSLEDCLYTTEEDDKYKLALAQLKNSRITEAITTLSFMGDVYLANRLFNALTNSDIAGVEQDLEVAVVNPKTRFLQGKRPGELPKEDQFDFLDFVTLLSESNAGFKPWDSSFNYKRIGKSSVTKEGYPKFEVDLNQDPIGFKDLVYNSEELNLSVRANIQGYILLPEQVEVDGVTLKRRELNLPTVWNCSVFRNYSFIQNAFPNITSIKLVNITKEEFESLTKGSVEYASCDDGLLIDLSKIIACNKLKGKFVKLEDLAKDSYEMLELKNIVKVLRHKVNQLDPNKSHSAPITWTEDQRKFLNNLGVTNENIYSPPVEPQESTDVIPYRIFSVKISKSSEVKVDDVIAKRDSGKPLNLVETNMVKGLQLIDDLNIKNETKLLPEVVNLYESYNRKLKDLQNKFNSSRLSFALSNKWVEVTTEDSYSLPFANTTVNFQFLNKEKPI